LSFHDAKPFGFRPRPALWNFGPRFSDLATSISQPETIWFAFSLESDKPSARVQRIFSFLLLLFLPMAALADGMVVPTIAYPAKVTIPDQRALICFSNGTERLVIETRFTGAGTNFAWVVPLPSQPVIEEATTGLFPTLGYLFRPQIIHDVPRYYLGILALIWLLIWLVYIMLFVRPTGRVSLLDITSCLLVGVGIFTIENLSVTDGVDWMVMAADFIIILDLIFILTLVRLWNRLPRALGVAMLPLFLAPQFLLLPIAGAPGSLPLFLVVLFFLVFLDWILIASLVKSWKNASRAIATAMLISLLAFQAVLLVFVASVISRSAELRSKGMQSLGMDHPPTPSQAVSILDRKIVGVFETTTITSHDAKALQTWLSENGFTVPTNAEPVIASYVKDDWVFVTTKVRRDKPDNETSTPHPLSFTFKTDKPVYPMQLTGLNSQSLSVDLYVFSDARATAPHFKVESCTRLNRPPLPSSQHRRPDYWQGRNLLHSSTETLNIVHPLLRQWTGDSAVATRLTATLSPADMRKDARINWKPFSEKKNRLFSQQGAWTMSLNWGTGILAAGLFVVCLLAFAGKTHKTKLLLRVGFVTVASVILAGLVYRSLPKTEVVFVHGYSRSSTDWVILYRILHGGGWQTMAEARAKLQGAGQIHEEDSPGNYLLRETNNQMQLIFFDPDGGEVIAGTWDLPHEH
jgi:hypothetical protein